MNKKLSKDEINILFYAFRYAIGRQTMAGLTITGYILKRIDQFPEHEIKQLIRETEHELDMWKKFKKEVMQCDIELWTNFAKQLRKEVKGE